LQKKSVSFGIRHLAFGIRYSTDKQYFPHEGINARRRVPPPPYTKGYNLPFRHLKLHPKLLTGIDDLGFARPTPIQTDAIPPALEGRDVLACAMTGSGKTAAFLLPILHRLIDRPRGTTRAVVLTPTRELAAQILEDLQDLAAHTSITGASVFGGVGMEPQKKAFRKGVDVLIATPGRLLDHFGYPYARLPSLEYLVIDEADRMFDMGFLPDVGRILRHLPARRQTFFFSATLPPPIVVLARQMLSAPATINIERPVGPAIGITHSAYPVAQDRKLALLVALLQSGGLRQVLVFTRTKHRADHVSTYLVRNGLKSECLHGNRSQGQRTEALAGFKSGKYRILVATDIAARGIDVEALSHVVNFDVPKAPDDYIHRVGRTARAGATGDAFTFVAPEEEEELRRIERVVGKRIHRTTVPEFDYGSRSGGRVAPPMGEGLAVKRATALRNRGRTRVNVASQAAQRVGEPALDHETHMGLEGGELTIGRTGNYGRSLRTVAWGKKR
jgi:ATP-dependent RNA helicase RhlE